MRHQPAFVDRIAREAAAEMIVDAALAHALERVLDGLEKSRIAGTQASPPQHLQDRRLRKLRRAAQAAVDRIEHIADLPRGGVKLAHADRHLARGPRLLGEPRQQRHAVLLDPAGFVAEQPRHLAQHIDKGRAAETALFRKIRAAPHRLAGGGEKHRHRPAALLAQQMQRAHVNLVDVGPFLAVHLDVDEQFVHHPRRRFVLERLVRHHMAPVAGGVANREQNRLAGFFRFIERPRAPLPPVDRIVLVLQQIRRRGAGQAIAVGGLRRCHRRSLTRIHAGHDFRPDTASPPPHPTGCRGRGGWGSAPRRP